MAFRRWGGCAWARCRCKGGGCQGYWEAHPDLAGHSRWEQVGGLALFYIFLCKASWFVVCDTDSASALRQPVWFRTAFHSTLLAIMIDFEVIYSEPKRSGLGAPLDWLLGDAFWFCWSWCGKARLEPPRSLSKKNEGNKSSKHEKATELGLARAAPDRKVFSLVCLLRQLRFFPVWDCKTTVISLPFYHLSTQTPHLYGICLRHVP